MEPVRNKPKKVKIDEKLKNDLKILSYFTVIFGKNVFYCHGFSLYALEFGNA